MFIKKDEIIFKEARNRGGVGCDTIGLEGIFLYEVSCLD